MPRNIESYGALCVMLLGPPALAVEPQTGSLERVEVSGEPSVQQMREVIAGRLILGRGWLEQSNALSIEDILRRDPAVTVSATGKIGLQGLPGYTEILLDGERPPTGIHPLELPPAQVERIEIIRGAMAETGMFAIAGTINVIRRKQRSTLPLEVSASVIVPTAALRSRFSAQASWRDDATGSVLGFRLNADRQRTRSRAVEEGWQVPDPEALVWRNSVTSRSEIDTLTLSPTLSLKLSSDDSLRLSADLGNYKIVFPQESTLVRGDGSAAGVPQRSGSRWNTTSWPTLSGGAEWECKLSSGGNLLARMQLRTSDERQDMNGRAQFNDGVPQQLSNTDTLHRRSADLRLQRKGLTLGEHKLQWGLQWKQERLSHERGLDVDGEESFIDRLFSPRSKDINSDASTWIEDDWEWSDDLSLNVGLRYQHITHRLDDPMNPSQLRLALLAPSVSAAWKLGAEDEHTLSLDLSRSFNAPLAILLNPRPRLDPSSACASRATCGLNQPNAPDKAGNPELRPETSWGIGVHLDSSLAERSSISAGLSGRWIADTNVRATALELVFWSAGPRWVDRPINAGRARSWSMDLGFSLAMADWIEQPVPALEVTGSLQWAGSRVSSVLGPDNRLPDQSPFAARMGLKYKMQAWPIEWRCDWSLHPANWWRDAGGLERWESTRSSWSLSASWSAADAKRSLSVELTQLAPNRQVTRSIWVGSPYGRTESTRPTTALVLGWSAKL